MFESLVTESFCGWGSIVAFFACLLMSTFVRPNIQTGYALFSIWILAWAFGAEQFADAKAVGTGLRWLLPIGGAIAAASLAFRRPLVPAWAVVRNQLGLSGRSYWQPNATQALINYALTVVAAIVLTISTITICQVMLAGGVDALGGPLKGTLFGDMKKDISFGGPVGIMVGTFLLYAISERRTWLATAGSMVFQYCVLLSVILLFVSPHPKLASSWFVNILQAVSIGMTGYGFVWFFFLDRINGSLPTGTETAKPSFLPSFGIPQIETHSLINGVLISALAILVIARFFAFPFMPGDWINSVGSWLGVFAWALYGILGTPFGGRVSTNLIERRPGCG